MRLEHLARLFVGAGFVWVVLVLVVGVLGGFDKPTAWLRFVVGVTGWGGLEQIHRALTFVVVPLGMLIILRDILGDPVAPWVKFAAPGTLASVYALLLLAAAPELGRAALAPFSALAPDAGVPAPLAATGTWLVRFATALTVLAGVPGLIGALVGAVFGGGARRT